MKSASHEFINDTLLGAQETLEVLVRELAAGAARITGCLRVAVWLYDGHHLVRVAPESHGEQNSSFSEPEAEIAGRAFREGRPLLEDGLDKPSRAVCRRERSGRPLRSVLAVPLSLAEKTLGSLVAVGRRPDAFGKRETCLLSTFGSLFGLAVHHCTFFPKFLPFWASYIGMNSEYLDGAIHTSIPWGDRSNRLPKGINEPTLSLLCDRLCEAATALSVAEISEGLGLSGVTIRRYLGYLEELGLVSRGSRYRETGRPSHIFWSTPDQSRRMAGYAALRRPTAGLRRQYPG